VSAEEIISNRRGCDALYTLAVEQIGIQKRRDDHGKYNAKEDPEAAEKSGEHDDDAADYPKPTGKAVCPVPVFFAVEGPGDLDADGIVLLALGQVIADDRKQQTHKHRHDHFYPDFLAQSHRIGNGIEQIGDHRDDPQNQMQNLLWMIVFLGIGTGA